MSFEKVLEELYDQMVSWRRDFHKYAESAWVEIRTASIVAEELTKLGYEVHCGEEVIREDSRMGIPSKIFLQEQKARALKQGAIETWVSKLENGFTGVVGILDTKKKGPTIGLRFDMDALDIQESEEDSHKPSKGGYNSSNPNMMHACGHDAHTAIGLSVATCLMEIKNQLKGKIVLIFQPAEEGTRGAKSMVDAGVLNEVDIFYASHIGGGFELGEVVTGTDGFLATTKMDAHFLGRAAHAGGQPEQGKNALLAAATAALNIHAISRHSNGESRINVGVMEAGSGRNVVPHYASLKIETRGETTEVNNYIREHTQNVLKGSGKMYGVEVKIDVVGEAKTAKSDERLKKHIQKQVEIINEDILIKEDTIMHGSDDATYMMNFVQENGGYASYLIFGTTLSAGHHNDKFDIDEKVLLIASKVLVSCILNSE